METKNCSKCGEPVKIIPAGVSKTKKDKYGKPKAYSSFYKCEGCGNTESDGYSSPQNYAKPSGNYAQKSYEPASQDKPDWDKIRAEAAEGQSFGNAKNVAAILLAAAMRSGELKLADAILKFPEVVQEIYDCDKKQVGVNDF